MSFTSAELSEGNLLRVWWEFFFLLCVPETNEKKIFLHPLFKRPVSLSVLGCKARPPRVGVITRDFHSSL